METEYVETYVHSNKNAILELGYANTRSGTRPVYKGRVMAYYIYIERNQPMKTIKLLQATKITPATTKAVEALGITKRRATHGVGRNGDLMKVLNYNKADNTFTIYQHDHIIVTWTATEVATHFAA